MMKKLLLLVVCLACGLSLISTAGKSAHGDEKAKAALENHMKTVKTKHPQKYQEMLEAAGGNIVNCMSCHGDIFKDTGTSRTPRRR